MYLEQVERFSKAYNITGLKGPLSLAERGIIDSLFYLDFIPPRARTLIDIGSGAGLPGLIIKMARPELEVTLLEPSRKKAAFLEFVTKKLALPQTWVFQCSVEEFALQGGPYDVITTRALFTAEEVLKKTRAFIKTGTRIILSKGPKAVEELEALKGLKNFRVQLRKKVLPFSSVERSFIVIDRLT